jgi:hypothetical protein
LRSLTTQLQKKYWIAYDKRKPKAAGTPMKVSAARKVACKLDISDIPSYSDFPDIRLTSSNPTA